MMDVLAGARPDAEQRANPLGPALRRARTQPSRFDTIPSHLTAERTGLLEDKVAGLGEGRVEHDPWTPTANQPGEMTLALLQRCAAEVAAVDHTARLAGHAGARAAARSGPARRRRRRSTALAIACPLLDAFGEASRVSGR
jgi:hypothetical protein